MRPRSYITEETDARVKKYAKSRGLNKKQAYSELIDSVLDADGNIKQSIILTEMQRKAIDEISKDAEQSPNQVVHDIFNFAILVFGTKVPLNQVLMKSVPLMMDEMVDRKSGIALEILERIKSEIRAEGKLNPQAALRYDDRPGT